MFSSLLPKPRHSLYGGPNKIKLKKVSTYENLNQLVKLPDTKSSTEVIQNPSKTDTTISKFHLNPDGTLNYNLTIASSNGYSKNVQASYEDTIPLKTKFPNLKHHFPRYTIETCPDDSLEQCLEDTRAVINRIIEKKSGVSDSTKNSKDDVTFIKYTSSNIKGEIGDNYAHGEEGRASERFIQIRNYQEDPMLPPKFKLRKNRHKEPSPPPPLLKSSNHEQTKLTKEDQAKWQIPSAISNWKNNQGFTISLDKRMIAANGGTEQTTGDVNLQKFGELSQALESADKQAREEIKIRNEMLKQLAIKEQHEKESKLKELADIARNKKLNSSGKRSNGDYDEISKKRKY